MSSVSFPAENLTGPDWPDKPLCGYNLVVFEADSSLDIRGEVCPYTYVKTRLALEEMQPGQILRVQTDYEPATRSVPRSVALQGDQVLSIRATKPGEWELLIRKH